MVRGISEVMYRCLAIYPIFQSTRCYLGPPASSRAVTSSKATGKAQSFHEALIPVVCPFWFFGYVKLGSRNRVRACHAEKEATREPVVVSAQLRRKDKQTFLSFSLPQQLLVREDPESHSSFFIVVFEKTISASSKVEDLIS